MSEPALWPDEIPAWLRARALPREVLLGPGTALLGYARAKGHQPPSLLELDAARRRRLDVEARSARKTGRP